MNVALMIVGIIGFVLVLILNHYKHKHLMDLLIIFPFSAVAGAADYFLSIPLIPLKVFIIFILFVLLFYTSIRVAGCIMELVGEKQDSIRRETRKICMEGCDNGSRIS